MKKDRITTYFEYKGYGSSKSFCKRLGISDSHVTEIDSRRKNTTLEIALRSNSEFSDLNFDWLWTGKGEMLISSKSSVKYDNSGHEEDNKCNKTVISDNGKELRSDQIDILKKWDKITDCRKRCALLALMDSMEG